MLFIAADATLAAKWRFAQATPPAKPQAPPSKPNINERAGVLCRLYEEPLKRPMHVPSIAGTNASRNDSPRKESRDLPLRNASRPERAPSSPELTTFLPCSIFDFDQVASAILLLPEWGDRRSHYTTSSKVSPWQVSHQIVSTVTPEDEKGTSVRRCGKTGGFDHHLTIQDIHSNYYASSLGTLKQSEGHAAALSDHILPSFNDSLCDALAQSD